MSSLNKYLLCASTVLEAGHITMIKSDKFLTLKKLTFYFSLTNVKNPMENGGQALDAQ